MELELERVRVSELDLAPALDHFQPAKARGCLHRCRFQYHYRSHYRFHYRFHYHRDLL